MAGWMQVGLLCGAFLAPAVSGPLGPGFPKGGIVTVPLDAAQGQLPESITADRAGNLYFSGRTKVWRLPAGSRRPVLVAALPLPDVAAPHFAGALGVAYGRDGHLYVVSGATSADLDAARVWRISPTGQVRLHARLDPAGMPNDLAFDASGNLFVTDSRLGRVYKVEPPRAARSEATVTTWLTGSLLARDPSNPGAPGRSLGANGIAFDVAGRNLYIGNFDSGHVRVPLERYGQPGEAKVFASGPVLKGADGLTLAEDGSLYVAVNTQNKIVTISPHGSLSVMKLPTGVLNTPSSPVFTKGTHDLGEGTLHVSNFALREFLAGRPPRPGIVDIPAPAAGSWPGSPSAGTGPGRHLGPHPLPEAAPLGQRGERRLP
ncbi:SMP-30/gluconolactonase/LRE family protein [Streptomyces sp. NPDC003042]